MTTDDLYRLLRAGHAQAQGIVDTVSDPLLVLDAGLCVQAASRSFFQTFGVDSYDTIGRPIYELGNGQWNIPELRRLLEEVIPKASAIVNYAVEHEFPQLGRRNMLITARTLYQTDGGSRTMLLSIVDATQQHQRDVAKDLLLSELRHRMNNLLGVIQALARLTATAGRSAEDYRDAFMGRLTALIAAENHAYDDQEATDLKKLIERIVAPYLANQGAIEIESGDAVDLGPQGTSSLSLVLHEMATNAAKYGALSAPGGQVRISWLLDDANSKLKFTWVESGGPPVTEPASASFGTTLVRSTISKLDGHLEQEYAPDGYRAEIVIPLRSGFVED